jgi:hypothetical protein
MPRNKARTVLNRTPAVARLDGRPIYTLGPTGPQGIQGLQGDPGTTTWAGITDKPADFTPSAHAIDGAAHTGTLPWASLNKTGSSLADLATRASANLSDGANLAKKDADNAFASDQSITGYAKPSSGVKERGRTVPMGEFTTPTFAAGDFVGNGAMTWTVEAGDVVTYCSAIVGKKLTILYAIQGTTVGGTPNTGLQFRIPGGYTSAKTCYGKAAIVVDNGVRAEGYAAASTGSQWITVFKADVSTWAPCTNGSSVYGQIEIEVQ